MMVFSFLFVVLTLPLIFVLVNVFLKIIEKGKIFKDELAKNILRLVVKKSPTGESTHYFFFMLK